jgi:hypothetical protein
VLAHGLTVEMLADLVRAGLATATTERVVAPGYGARERVCGSRRRGGMRFAEHY